MESIKSVYLDSCFLISYFVKNHEDYNSSRILFFEFVEDEVLMYVSNLALDETYYKIHTLYSQYPHKDFYRSVPDFQLVLEEVKSADSNFKLIQFDDPASGAESALENILSFNFAPRDAYHLAYAQELGVDKIVTKDKDFKEIEVLSY